MVQIYDVSTQFMVSVYFGADTQRYGSVGPEPTLAPPEITDRVVSYQSTGIMRREAGTIRCDATHRRDHFLPLPFLRLFPLNRLQGRSQALLFSWIYERFEPHSGSLRNAVRLGEYSYRGAA